MSTAYPFEPLRAVPALDPQRRRFALLLHLKDTLLRGRDAASGAVTSARSFVEGLVGRLHLQVPLGWLRHVASRLASYGSWAVGALGKPGLAATAGVVLASPTARHMLLPLLTAGASLGGRLARALVGSTDRALRCLGRPGHAAADRLQTRLEDSHRCVTQVAQPVLRRSCWLVDPAMPQMRALGRLARSYLLHRACTLVVRRRLLRLLVEAVLIPAAVNSSLGARLRQATGRPDFHGQAQASMPPTVPAATAGTTAGTAARPDQQGEQPVDQQPVDPSDPAAPAGTTARPDQQGEQPVDQQPVDPSDAAAPGGPGAAHPAGEESAEPEPRNRAQRRAQQQQQARARRRAT